MVVYRHIRLDSNKVFYIGIGTEYRAYSKHHRNNWWKKVVNKTDYKVEILYDNLTKDLACELEVFLIKIYGRKDLKNGNLVNMTDGGDGTVNKSEEVRKKISENLKGKPSGMKGKKMSDEHKAKIGAANKISLKGNISPMKGKKHSEESLSKISENNKSSIEVIYKPTGEVFRSISYACKTLNLNLRKIRGRIKNNSTLNEFILTNTKPA